MQNAFSLNGDNMHKRLGDGYYEQRLVREQNIALTGAVIWPITVTMRRSLRD